MRDDVEVTDRQLEAFVRFVKLFPHDRDIEPKGVKDRIADLIESFPWSGPSKFQGQPLFGFTLWVLFVAVADLVQKPGAEVLQLIPGGKRWSRQPRWNSRPVDDPSIGQLE